MNKKVVYVSLSLLAIVGFGLGFGLAGIRITSAQSSTCTLQATEDWCSKWTLARWLEDRTTRAGFPVNGGNTDRMVGPSDWQVNGQLRISPSEVKSYTETWQLTKVKRAWKNNATTNETNKIDLARQGEAYVNVLDTNSVYAYSENYFGNFTGRLNPAGLYGQIRWGVDGEPSDSQVITFFPTEWTVSGRFQ